MQQYRPGDFMVDAERVLDMTVREALNDAPSYVIYGDPSGSDPGFVVMFMRATPKRPWTTYPGSLEAVLKQLGFIRGRPCPTCRGGGQE